MELPASLLRRRYKDLSLQQLRSFCEVCRLGSYAAAAREMMLTSPAVWEQLRGLERHFEMELFEKQGGDVRPTIHGQRLLKLVRPLLAGLDSSKDVLHQQIGELPDQLMVVSNLRVLLHEISRGMCQFQKKYPSVRLLIRYTAGEEVEPLVLEGDSDVTLTLEPAADQPVSAAISYEPAGGLDYLLVAPPRHPLMQKDDISLEAIVEHPLVLGEPEAYSRHRVQEVFHRHNLIAKMQVVTETSSDEYTLACVRAGMGVGIAVGNASSPLFRGLAVCSLREWFGIARVGFLWRAGAYVAPVQRELADLLRRKISTSRKIPRKSAPQVTGAENT